MKNLLFFFSVSTLLLAYSCTSDISSATVTYTQATAIYGDLNEQRNIPLKADAREIQDPGKVYVSEELLLIGEEGEGIHIYDNTNPENPAVLSFMNIPNNKEFFVKDNFIYAESLYDMLKIDISDKTNPRIVSRVENAFVQELTNDRGEILLGFDFEVVTEEVEEGTDIWREIYSNGDGVAFRDYQMRIIPKSNVPASFAGSSNDAIGSINRIAHAKDHVYVISNHYLTTFSDDNNLTLISSQKEGWDVMETIYPQGDELFVGSQASVRVFDIEDPSTPNYKTRFNHVRSCDPVLPDGDVAYVTLRSNNTDCPGDINGLIVLDITQTRIQELQTIVMESPFGLTKIGDLLYVGEGNNGLKIFDASNQDGTLSMISEDSGVQAYDVIPHPTRTDVILIAGPDGFSQYRVNEDNQSLDLLSVILI
jgi:hypothetical protein